MSTSAVLTSVRRLRSVLAAQQGHEHSDEQLLTAFADRRDEIAFAALLRRHGPMVLGVCRRVLGHEQDAEDAFQATFLVLARRAASLRTKSALASFLYGTAYNLASKAKRAAGRRRKHEDCVPTRSTVDPTDELLWREVRALLEEEIARLPEEHRSVFVLCCLEELSQAEAGRLLGVKKGTVSNRLAEARRQLSWRLRQRGIELTAVLAATGLASPEASALPARLMATTIEVALVSAAGERLTGVVSASVAELVQGATTAMMASRAKIALGLLLAVTLLGGAGVSLLSGELTPPETGNLRGLTPPAPKADAPRAAVREAANTLEIHGRVLGADGQPKAGAKLLLLDENEEKKLTELGVSAADGRFTVSVPKQVKGRRLIAQTDNAGIDFEYAANLKPVKPAELRLVPDRPIRGRILTTEGKPVAGVRVAVRNIRAYANNSLASFLIAWAKRRGNSEMPDGVKSLWPDGTALFAATTDAEGRFVLRGIGSERVVLLHVSGPGIASTERWVVNRDGFDAKPYNEELRTFTPKRVFYGPWTMMSGPDVSIVAEREKIIRGIVKDADTGKGIAGATIWLTGNGDHALIGGLLALPVNTRTDAEGRYEIRGARKLKSYLLQVMKNRAAGYLDGVVLASDDTFGNQPITVDVPVKKGVIVTGKVIDRSTGKPVPGDIETVILNGNPFAKYISKERYSRMIENAETGKDGTFRDVVVPGPVLLKFNADWTRLPGGEAEVLGYKRSIPDPKYSQYFQVKPDGETYYIGLDGVPGGVGGIACKVVDAKPGTAIVHQDLVVERDSARTVKIEDADGKPLRGVWVAGIRPKEWSVCINSDVCPVYAVEAGKPRFLIFYERRRKLAATLTVKGTDKEPTVVRLSSTGALRGCLRDHDGKPLAGVVVDVRYCEYAAQRVHEIVHAAKEAVTNADGAFTLDELIPELKFELSFRIGKRRFERETKPDDPAMQIKSGECRDLGAIEMK